MPAFTPNRNYPYSVPGDPADVPAAMQSLAEAIDTDVSALQQNVPIRPAFSIRGTNAIRAVTSPPLNTFESLTFDTELFNTGLDYTISTTSVVNEGVVCVVRPQLPGFFWLLASVAIPRPTDGTNRIEVKVGIRRENNAILVEESSHLQPSASDGIRTGAVAVGAELNGSTEGLQVAFSSRTAAGGLDTYTVLERTLTVIRMSPTFP